MKSIFKYIILAGLRNRLYIGLFITIIIAFSLSIFLGSTTLIEQQQATASYVAGSSRIILIIGMILFVCLNISHAFENKEIEFILSKGISREKFILSYLIGFLFSAFLILIPLLIAILILTSSNKIGLAIWSLSLLSELLITISFALLASLLLKNSFSAIISSFSFYLISRMMGIFVMAINLPKNFSEAKNHLFASLLKFISAIFPRLDLFSQSSWLNYGINDTAALKIILWQSIIYIPLLIFMSFHDFKKKQF